MNPADLFVYGTLRSGFVNPFARLLAASAVLRGAARVRGRLFLVDDYPGAVPPATDSDWISGEVWTPAVPETTLRALDEYEGCAPKSPEPHEFTRGQTQAFLGSKTLTVWIYWYCFDIVGKTAIPDGDFLRWCSVRN